MSGIHGDGRAITGPGFPSDDGSAPPAVAAALEAYRNGSGGEHAVVAAIAASRLLVPVVALADGTEPAALGGRARPETGAASGGGPRRVGGAAPGHGLRQEAGAASGHGLRQEAGADMALPTLVGRDGRRAVPAFTSAATIAAWRPDARPVPVATADVCAAALSEEAVAVLVDVAGPVPVTLTGARLSTLAAGAALPPLDRDPDVLAALHAATTGEPSVHRVRVTLTPDADLAVTLELAAPEPDHASLAHRVTTRLTPLLPGRLTRGVAFTVTQA